MSDAFEVQHGEAPRVAALDDLLQHRLERREAQIALQLVDRDARTMSLEHLRFVGHAVPLGGHCGERAIEAIHQD